jgi:cell division protein FtsI (penicillin-binding protein 3)
MTTAIDPDVRSARPRLRLLAGVALLLFVGLGARLADLALLSAEAKVRDRFDLAASRPAGRADIVDRHGQLLATDYPKVSVYADPAHVQDPAGTAAALAQVLPDLDPDLAAGLASQRRFLWVKRHITDAQQRAVIRLGLPGIDFKTEMHRIYPQRALAAHIVGYVGVENQGLAGIERSFEDRLTEGAAAGPLRLTLDLGVQEILRDELTGAVARFQAKGGSGLVMEAGSGALLGAVSLPDFDPNHYQRVTPEARFNRNTQGSYELGSLFKVLTAAMTLDAGTIRITDGYDASAPLKIARHRIDDFHAKRRWLSVPEIIAFSSNIGAAKMAQALGAEGQRAYFERFGLLQKHPIRLPEVSGPQVPAVWRPINTVTAAYGHGIAVTPLQALDAVAAAICPGPRAPAHVVAEEALPLRASPVSPLTAAQLRWLMWLVVAEGTGTNAKVPGYLVGGKTGSADKIEGGAYRHGKLLTSFVGAFPIDAPRYLVLVTLDEPKGDAETFYQNHGGWTAATTVGRVVSRIGPLLGLPPADAATEKLLRAHLEVGRAYNGRLHVDEPSFKATATPWEQGLGGDAGCGCGACSIPG